MNTLQETTIVQVLNDLHEKATEDAAIRSEQRKAAAENGSILRPPGATAYLAVSREIGEFLYLMASLMKAENIVEFGCSFGISAIYLGAAARNNGGHVTTTDLEINKVEGARANIARAGLEDEVSILHGDAMHTLATIDQPIDLLFLDGAKDLYIPVLEMLRPQLRKGALVLADNADHDGVQSFNQLIRSSKTEYISSMLFEGRLLAATIL